MVHDSATAGADEASVLLTVSEQGADPERLDELTRMLREELAEVADDIRPVSAGEAPPGTRAVDIAAVGALLVAIKGAAPAVAGVVSVIRAWLNRGSSPRVVEMTIEGKTLRLDGATDQQQQQLIDEFVQAVRAG